jgi:hypothetical protein
MALLHESNIKPYDPRHSGNCAAIIRNLAFYYHWIPAIFPDIQEKFRDDAALAQLRHPGKRVSDYSGPMLYVIFRDDSGIIHSCNKAILDCTVVP